MTTKTNTLKKLAAIQVDELIAVAMRKRKWTKEESTHWMLALTQLRKLAGLSQ